MLQPKNEPLFEQLKADVEATEVRQYFRTLGKQRKRRQRESKR